jgi:hypothetical protein
MRATFWKIRGPKVIRATRYRSRPSRSPMNVEQDGDEGVGREAGDEDPIVVDPIELGADRTEDRVERRDDRDGRVAGELETDVDLEQ